jgi:hypothetical protein
MIPVKSPVHPSTMPVLSKPAVSFDQAQGERALH